MSRVTIKFPEPIRYWEETEIPPSEMNHGQHLGFERAVELISGIRLRFFRHLGLSDLDVGGAGIIIADLAVRYKAEIFAGERLRVEVAVGNPAKKSCDIFYRFVKAGDVLPALVAKTGIAFFDYSARKTAAMPALFRKQLFGVSPADSIPEMLEPAEDRPNLPG